MCFVCAHMLVCWCAHIYVCVCTYVRACMHAHACVWVCTCVPTCLVLFVSRQKKKNTCLLSSRADSSLTFMSANHLWISAANVPWLLSLSQPARDRNESWWLDKQTLPVLSSLFKIILLLSSEAKGKYAGQSRAISLVWWAL